MSNRFLRTGLDRCKILTTLSGRFVIKHRRYFQALFGVAVLILVIWQSHPDQLKPYILGTPLHLMVPWLLIYHIVAVLLWALCIYTLMQRIRPGGLLQIIDASFKVQAISVLVPSRLGDLGILYFLKDEYSLTQTSTVFITDKIITLLLYTLLAAIGVGVLTSWIFSVGLILAMAVGFAVLFWVLLKCPQELLQKVGMRHIQSRFTGLRVEIKSSLKDYKAIAINFTITLFRFCLSGILTAVVFSWFGVKASVIKIILFCAVAQFVILIPVTIMGLGVQEALHVTLFGKLGVPPEVVLAAGLWGRVIHLGFCAMIYLYWMFTKTEPCTDTTT